MRTFAILLIVGALGGFFVWQKNNQPVKTAPAANTVQTRAPAASPAVVAAQAPREPSEQNWMKRSLDRARDVRDQARKNTRDSQNP